MNVALLLCHCWAFVNSNKKKRIHFKSKYKESLKLSAGILMAFILQQSVYLFKISHSLSLSLSILHILK